jgi:GNAT superfamily N-acetyltransferase
MVGTVQEWPTAVRDLPVQLGTEPTAAWQSVYLSGDFDPLDGANRVRALSRSRHLVYASLSDASGAVAAGTASFSQGWASLHGMRTIARERGKGSASALIAAMGQAALTRGVDRCFLQVEEGNAAAIRLYRSLGFQAAWLYHYWRKVP